MSSSDKVYSVQRRFRLGHLIGATTLFACVFGGLRQLDSHPFAYIFFTGILMASAIAQMVFGKGPRLASVLTGAILCPISMAAFMGPSELACVLIPCVIGGALLGYMAGVVMASVFLVTGFLEDYVRKSG